MTAIVVVVVVVVKMVVMMMMMMMTTTTTATTTTMMTEIHILSWCVIWPPRYRVPSSNQLARGHSDSNRGSDSGDGDGEDDDDDVDDGDPHSRIQVHTMSSGHPGRPPPSTGCTLLSRDQKEQIN